MARKWTESSILSLMERKKKWNGMMKDFYIKEKMPSSQYYQLIKRINIKQNQEKTKLFSSRVVQLHPDPASSKPIEITTPAGYTIKFSSNSQISLLQEIMNTLGENKCFN